MLNLVIFFMIIIIQVKTFTIFYCLNKTTRQRMFLKNFLIKIVLRHISALFCRAFLSTTKKSLIFLPLKIQNIGNPRYKLLHTRKMLDTVGLKKIEEKNKQFLLEKIILGIEFENLYVTDSEKKKQKLCIQLRKTIELREEFTNSST